MRTSGTRIVGWLIAGTLGSVFLGGAVVVVGLAFASNVNVCVFSAPDQQRESEFARTWAPPLSGAGAERLLPGQVNEWRIVSHDDAAAIPELALDRAGLHARYESGAGFVEVYAFEVPAAEQAALFDAADSAILSAGYRSMGSHRDGDSVSSRLKYSVSPPDTDGWLWWSRGWLFVFTTHDSSVDLDAFKEGYLSSISAQGQGQGHIEPTPAGVEGS